MAYTIDDVREILRALVDEGLDGIIIGDTVLALALGRKNLEGDIDVFAVGFSPLFEEEKIRSIAEEHGWDVGTTDLGTPSIIARVKGKTIVVELYENILDFYVPEDVIEESVDVGLPMKAVSLEAYVLLKSRAGREEDDRDLAEIAELASKGKIKLDLAKIRRLLSVFPEEDLSTMVHRLRKAGINV